MWKIQLKITINFISSKACNASKSDNIEIVINDEVDEELFKSLCNRYQNNLGKSMKDSEFFFDCVYLLYYKCHKINLDHGGSYKDFPNWIKKSNNKSCQQSR